MRNQQPKQKILTRAITAALAVGACGGTINANAASELEEVIVTAQKKDETLQTVPMTVNAVTADTIAKYNLLDFKDIQSVTPGLTIKAVDSRTATIAMRGVNVLVDTGFGPGVAIYWNEVNYDIDSAFKAMYDIGQVEVLRGPQGTLRGITAPAGAVTIVTKAPSFNEIEGTVEQTLGERSLSNSQFAMSLPIIEDKLALRIAGLYDYNKTDGIKNIVNGQENTVLTRSGRATLGLRATDNLEAQLVYQYMEGNNSGDSPVVGCGTGNVTRCLAVSDRKSVNPIPDNTLRRTRDTALRVEWNLEGYELTSITGYRELTSGVSRDTDYGNALPAGTTNINTSGPGDLNQIVNTNGWHTFSQEVRFATTDADFYNWTYGLYGSRELTNSDFDASSLLAFYVPLGTPDPYLNVGYGTAPYAIHENDVSEGYAAFTNQSFQWTDRFDTQIGLRYQSKRAWTRIKGDVIYASKETNEGVTGTASAAYQLTDDVRLYTTYGRSFRPGGFAVATTAPADLTQYQPETSDAIELGFKSRWADGRLQINGDIYYQKYHNYQIQTDQQIRSRTDTFASTDPQHLQPPISTTLGNDLLSYNADALVTGAELQMDALLTDDWQAGLGISYTDAKFTDGKAYCNIYDANGVVQNPPVGQEVNRCDAKGRLSGEPNWGATASSEYTFHFGAVDSFVRGLYTFTSGRSDDAVAGSVLDTTSYGVFNLFAGVRDQKKTWEVSVWAKNLFDHQQVIRYSPESTLGAIGLDAITSGPVPDSSNPAVRSGYSQVQVIPERQLGITGKYNFSL